MCLLRVKRIRQSKRKDYEITLGAAVSLKAERTASEIKQIDHRLPLLTI